MNILKMNTIKEDNKKKLEIIISQEKGKKLNEDLAIKIANKCNKDIDSLIIKGNDPMFPDNIPGISYLLEFIEISLKRHINTWIYTDYLFKDLLLRKIDDITDKYTLDILIMTDILVENNSGRKVDINKTVKNSTNSISIIEYK